MSTCSIIAVTLVSPAIVCPVTVVGVKQVDVLVVVTDQELCTERNKSNDVWFLSTQVFEERINWI